jgi:catechol-2,3-dioxygenase
MSAAPRVTRLNHAVLFVRDVQRSVEFYRRAFGFEVVQQEGSMAFLRAPGAGNHHDLGLFGVGEHAPQPARGSVGLYHLAWEVATIEDLVTAREVLANLGALTGQSDHGASKSLYGKDPDGNEFEVMFAVPREEWGEFEHRAVTRPLALDREVARFGGRVEAP